MSGIVGSKLNIRGSGRIAKLGTDGQVLTSSGAGVAANYEDIAGGISWQSVVTASTFTAVAGNGYPVNTTSNACTVTLPASASVGDEIIFTDYLRTWGTNNLTINPNSLNYQGNASPNPVYDTDGESIHIVYVDATQGWTPTYDGAVALETPQDVDVEYLVVAGGGGGGHNAGGAGGAGGYLTNYGGTAIGLNPSTAYTITIGTGGAGATSPASGTVGVDSVLSGTGITTITADGGGAGGGHNLVGGNGGSGGGSGSSPGGDVAAGTGTAGPPRQGYDGSIGGTHPDYLSGGGGGATEAGGTDGTSYGGDGTANSITGSSVTYAGGGGGGTAGTAAPGGDGGGGAGSTGAPTGTAGTDGLGGGGGGGGTPNGSGGDGGNGIIILRMPDADAAAGTKVNEDSTATDVGGSGETVITWLVSGSFTTG